MEKRSACAFTLSSIASGSSAGTSSFMSPQTPAIVKMSGLAERSGSPISNAFSHAPSVACEASTPPQRRIPATRTPETEAIAAARITSARSPVVTTSASSWSR